MENAKDKVGHGISIISLPNAHPSCYYQTKIYKTTAVFFSVQDRQDLGMKINSLEESFHFFWISNVF